MLYWLKQFTDNTNHIILDKAYSYYKIRQLTRITSNTRFDQKTPLFVHININTTTLTGFRTKLSNHKYHTGHTETFAFDPASNRVPLPNTNNSSQNTQGKQGQEQKQEQALTGIHPKTKRPISLISQGKQIAYCYDVHGNIKTKTETPIDSKTGEPIYQSDKNLIGYRKSVQFAYNPNNELKQTITITDTGLEVQRTTTSYFYDAFGRRIGKTSKVERLNKLNQRGELVCYPTTLMHLRKTDKTTYQSTLMLWEGNRQIQEYTNDFVFTTVYDQDSFVPISRLVQDRQDTSQIKVYHYHNNHLGTPQELTDECGEVVWCNYEFAWGGRYTHHYATQSLNGCAIIESDLQPIRFQGQFYDIETGLHYNRFRYYDSDVGMFISRDPIGLLGGMNVFAYAPNPIHWIDVLGLKTVNAKVVQFSQDSVSTVFDNGNKLNSLTHAMSNNPNYYQGVNPIRVIKFQDLPSGVQTKLFSQGANPYGIYSLDNRRLLAAKEAGSKINIKFVKPKDVPDINLEKRFSTKNGGKLPTKRC